VICPETPTGTKNSDFAENGAAAPTLQNKLPSPAHTGEILRLETFWSIHEKSGNGGLGALGYLVGTTTVKELVSN